MPNKKEQKSPIENSHQVAQLLLSKILNEQLKSLSRLTEYEYEKMCEEVTPYLNDEYRIWQGNSALLTSCLDVSKNRDLDPARVILNRVVQIARDSIGLLILA